MSQNKLMDFSAVCNSAGNRAGNSVECPGFKENLDSLWDKSKTKARHLNPIDGDQIVNFINYQVRST